MSLNKEIKETCQLARELAQQTGGMHDRDHHSCTSAVLGKLISSATNRTVTSRIAQDCGAQIVRYIHTLGNSSDTQSYEESSSAEKVDRG